MLESMMGIAYARTVIPNEPIHPLQDVWLRPRRVFRELAAQPVGLVDHLLGAAQGMVSMLGYCRAKDFGAKFGLGEIFFTASVTGAVVGIASLHIMATIYARLGARAGRTATRRQAVHVLAYGGVPMAASLGIWVLTALIAGEITFVQAPKEVDDFVGLLLGMQFLSYVALLMWSVVLQVMGFSEVLAVSNAKAFGIWVLGQLIAVLAILFLYILTAPLFGT
jgi:Yip1 domain